MREIKFRAWNKTRKKMGRVQHLSNTDTKGEYITFEVISFKETSGMNAFHEGLAKKDYILMQYTGLKDKNGKELYYDSDIVLLDGSDKKFYATKDDFDIPVWIADEGNTVIDFRDWFMEMPKKSFTIIGNKYEDTP